MPIFNLIVTADDYGVSPAVDDAIIDSIKKGLVNSVTVLMNFEGSVDALKRLARFLRDKNLTNSVGVGIHLNVVTGKPILDDFNGSIVKDKSGNFHTSGHYLNTKSIELPNQVQINKELISQIDLFLTTLPSKLNVLFCM